MQLLKERFDHRMQLYELHVDHFGITSDHEISPDEMQKDLYKYADFLKIKTADPFPPQKLFSRYFHHCGFKRNMSPQDIYINSPWHEEQAALAILKALILFDDGANVSLLLQRKSYQDSPNRPMLDLFGKVISEGYLKFSGR